MEFRHPVAGARLLNEGLPAVVISTGGSPGAYDMVRCLRNAGIKSCVMSANPRDIAFFSRGCMHRVQLPPFERHNDGEILGKLMEYGRACVEKPVLIYASDPELRFVWEHRNDLKTLYRFLLPPEQIFEPLFNKVLFPGFAEQYGLPVPRSVTCETPEDVQARMDQIPFPCIVKPAFSEHWNWKENELSEKYGPYKSALRRFGSEQELLNFCRDLPQKKGGFVVQEYVEGRDESIFSFHGYFDESSDCQAWFVGRKIRTYPMHTGGSAYIKTLHNPGLAQASILFLQRIGYRGIVKIDYKRDKRTGRYYMFEINTRYNLWQVLGMYAGVNLVSVAFCHQAGFPVEGSRKYLAGKKLLYLKQDLRAFLTGYRQTGEWNVWSYLRSLTGNNCFRVLEAGDPLPFIVSITGFMIRNLKRVVQRILAPFAMKPAQDEPADREGLEFVQNTWVEK